MRLKGYSKEQLENLLKLEGSIDPKTIEYAKDRLREYERHELGADAYVDMRRVKDERRSC